MFYTHCESREAKRDLAYVTVYGYRKMLDSVWRPAIGERDFETIRYSDLTTVVDGRVDWSKKRYNHVVSVVRCAFEYGYRDLPEMRNPAERLKSLKIRKKDSSASTPFSVREAETIIAAVRKDWGEAQGNYEEFRFFTGLRPSEQLALAVSDCDLVAGQIHITKALVQGRLKDQTKTSEDRTIDLCSRAFQVLKRQMLLRDRLNAIGLIDHERMFFKETGEQFVNLQFGYSRWKRTLMTSIPHIGYRSPYCARHSWISWQLMIGKNLLWTARQNGHGVQIMLAIYARWLDGAGTNEIAAIKAAIERAPAGH